MSKHISRFSIIGELEGGESEETAPYLTTITDIVELKKRAVEMVKEFEEYKDSIEQEPEARLSFVEVKLGNVETTINKVLEKDIEEE